MHAECSDYRQLAITFEHVFTLLQVVVLHLISTSEVNAAKATQVRQCYCIDSASLLKWLLIIILDLIMTTMYNCSVHTFNNKSACHVIVTVLFHINAFDMYYDVIRH